MGEGLQSSSHDFFVRFVGEIAMLLWSMDQGELVLLLSLGVIVCRNAVRAYVRPLSSDHFQWPSFPLSLFSCPFFFPSLVFTKVVRGGGVFMICTVVRDRGTRENAHSLYPTLLNIRQQYTYANVQASTTHKIHPGNLSPKIPAIFTSQESITALFFRRQTNIQLFQYQICKSTKSSHDHFSTFYYGDFSPCTYRQIS